MNNTQIYPTGPLCDDDDDDDHDDTDGGDDDAGSDDDSDGDDIMMKQMTGVNDLDDIVGFMRRTIQAHLSNRYYDN